jgi:hypothetical protein
MYLRKSRTRGTNDSTEVLQREEREGEFLAKERNKKDLMRSSEVKWPMGLVPFWDAAGIWSQRSPALRDRYDRRYFATGGGRLNRSAARELQKLCASRD